jgi:hypothetical protein
MSNMYKTFLWGGLATLVLAAFIVFFLKAVDASGEISGVFFVLGAAGAGLIGAEVAKRLPPPRRHR